MKQSPFTTLMTILSLTLMVTGCFGGGGDPLPELTPVKGVVKFNGEPLKDAQIVFMPEKGRGSNGKTDEKGQYELYYNAEVQGAVTGNHTVKITVTEIMDLPAGAKQIVIPSQYNSKSKLEVTLSGTDPVTHDFDLKNSGK